MLASAIISRPYHRFKKKKIIINRKLLTKIRLTLYTEINNSIFNWKSATSRYRTIFKDAMLIYYITFLVQSDWVNTTDISFRKPTVISDNTPFIIL